MSGVSNTQTSNIATNVGPVSFSGISSGIDWNAVIQKETALSLAPITQYNNQITSLTAKNSELIKINGLLASVQSALVNLSNPAQFQTFTGTSSNPTAATATSVPGVGANPGVYTVTGDTLATTTQVTSAPADTVGKQIAGNVAIASDTFQITPTAGTSGQGKFTVDGVTLTYSPTDPINGNLDSILANLQTAVQAVDVGFTASYSSVTDTVTFQSSDAPISIGSPADTGNLITALKLDIASVANSPTSGLVQSAGPISGLNELETLNQNNANLITAVTAGTFSINGVSFSVDPTQQSVNDILQKINASSAGVIAGYNTVTGQITISNQQTGPRSVVFGSPTDSSNFLSALGLPDQSGAHGAATQVGQQASVTLQNPSGGTTTYYSGSNAVTNAIPGISINLLSQTSTPFTISVSQDSTTLVNNIQNFASAYNVALNELNAAIAPPVVQQNNATTSKNLTSSSSQLTGGGPLFGDFSISNLRDRLINLAQTVVNSNGTSFSLSSIGLQMSSTFSVLQATQAGAQTNGTNGTIVSGQLTTQVMQGTDGTFLPLDLNAFQAAFAANPSGVQDLFLDTNFGVLTQMGSYLTGATGSPTLLFSGSVGTIPAVSLIQADENQNTDTISSVQQFIQQLQDSATQQANLLQSQATAAETAIAGYQATQAQVTQLQNSGQL
ncbi:MAG TPA: flagellar filament capping protein FliD [Candidatus Binatia bacterium]|nr:flagellar filament capping protein FliD [Candidatus Binatia bacterium]